MYIISCEKWIIDKRAIDYEDYELRSKKGFVS